MEIVFSRRQDLAIRNEKNMVVVFIDMSSKSEPYCCQHVFLSTLFHRHTGWKVCNTCTLVIVWHMMQATAIKQRDFKQDSQRKWEETKWMRIRGLYSIGLALWSKLGTIERSQSLNASRNCFGYEIRGWRSTTTNLGELSSALEQGQNV